MTLAAYVEKHGLSVASKRLGVPRMTIWRWLNGVTKIAPLHRRLLASKGLTP